MIKTTLSTDRGIYGPKLVDGYKTNEASPFVIGKGHKLWTVWHVCGWSVDAMIPVSYPRTRGALKSLIERIEARLPAEVVTVGEIKGLKMDDAQRAALREIYNFAVLLPDP